jgi:hypothetical protein
VIRVILPHHLQTLANCEREVSLVVEGTVSQRSILDALEKEFPMLKGTVREHVTLKRRPRVRFFVCGRDVSLDPPGAELPEAIANGAEPFMIVGAVAGG